MSYCRKFVPARTSNEERSNNVVDFTPNNLLMGWWICYGSRGKGRIVKSQSRNYLWNLQTYERAYCRAVHAEMVQYA